MVCYRLKEDFPTNLWGRDVVLPKGAKLAQTSWQTPAGRQTGYVVDSIQFLIDLTGNSHDPHYRYAWVPAALAEPVPATIGKDTP